MVTDNFVGVKDLQIGLEYYLLEDKTAFGVLHHIGERGEPHFTPTGGKRLEFLTKDSWGYIAFPADETFEPKHLTIKKYGNE